MGWRRVDSQYVRGDNEFFFVGLLIEENEQKLGFQKSYDFPEVVR